MLAQAGTEAATQKDIIPTVYDENRKRDSVSNLDFQDVDRTMPASPGMKTTKPKGKQQIAFEQRIEELKGFKKKHGHCFVSRSSKDYKSLCINRPSHHIRI